MYIKKSFGTINNCGQQTRQLTYSWIVLGCSMPRTLSLIKTAFCWLLSACRQVGDSHLGSKINSKQKGRWLLCPNSGTTPLRSCSWKPITSQHSLESTTPFKAAHKQSFRFCIVSFKFLLKYVTQVIRQHFSVAFLDTRNWHTAVSLHSFNCRCVLRRGLPWCN